jgi:lycopene beta-cyclase
VASRYVADPNPLNVSPDHGESPTGGHATPSGGRPAGDGPAGGDLAGRVTDVDIAIVGAGGAGLNLVVELDRLAARTGRPVPSIALVDPVTRAGADRTWCFWDDGRNHLDPVVARSWTRVGLVDRAGRARTLDLTPLRYVMVAAADFYALAEESVARLGAVRVTAPVLAVTDGPDRAHVRTDVGQLRARWVFDSRPAPPRRPARTSWLQHFRGWALRFDQPVLDPGEAVLMDFSAVQPCAVQPCAVQPCAVGAGAVQPCAVLPGAVRAGAGRSARGGGLAFGYVLPTAADRALVEYTVFSRERLEDRAYDVALRSYLAARWPLVNPAAILIEAVEDGAIPMTDAVPARRVGRRVFRLGTAGGATRGASGYTFAAMQRQARAVAAALLCGSRLCEPESWGVRPRGVGRIRPVPPPAYPLRHRWMDAVLLRALDRGLVDGPDLFVRLFERNSPARVLRFLDGATSLGEDLAVMASAPMAAMSRAAAEDAAARVRARLVARPRAPCLPTS